MDLRDVKLPYLEASELSDSFVQITFVMNGMQAPRRSLFGFFKPGCSGTFHTRADNQNLYASTEQLGNGVLDISLSSKLVY